MPKAIDKKPKASATKKSGAKILLNDQVEEQKQLISQAFDKFNTTLQNFRDFQQKLEEKIRDLTAQLSQKNEQLNNILESLNSGLIVTDLAGNIISFNRAAYQITGIRKLNADFGSINHMFGHQIIPSIDNAVDLDKVAKNYKQEFFYSQPEGKKLYLETTTSLMRATQDQKNLGIIINVNDQTFIKKLEEEAEIKKRMAAMGQIAATLAHEIRNPLGGVEIFVSLLKKDLETNPNHLQIITQIQSATRSMNQIITNILEYSRQRKITKDRINLADLLNDFMSFYKIHARQQSVKLQADIKQPAVFIRGEAEKIKQCLQNLYMNSLQAIDGKGKILITLDSILAKDVKHINFFDNKQLSDAPRVAVLSIKDSGEGMSEETKKKLFDPFFTTKPKGTGLGLSVVKQIIEAHNGAIQIDSIPQHSTKISLYFEQLD